MYFFTVVQITFPKNSSNFHAVAMVKMNIA